MLPTPARGLLAIEAVILGMTSLKMVFEETVLEVILLLMFMVAGIYFMKDLLLFVFTKILINVRSKIALSVLFSFVAAVLSALRCFNGHCGADKCRWVFIRLSRSFVS